MFCPACGFEYTQKTNYCKRCGQELNPAVDPDTPKQRPPNVASMFWAVVVFCLSAFVLLLAAADHFRYTRGMNEKPLGAMLAFGILSFSIILLLLIWQLARMITAFRRTGQNVIVEKHFIREPPPAQLGVPTEQIPQAVHPHSVAEHTTRQFANLYESPKAEEKTGTR